jgi:hypothetical protein
MKQMIKRLGLVVAASAALSALLGAGTASATVLCDSALSTSGCTTTSNQYPAGTEIAAGLISGSSAILETTGGTTLVTCSGSGIAGKTSNAGSSTETVKAQISSLSWSGCTQTVKTLVLGELEVHHIAGTDNGTVTGKSTQVTVNGIFGESCVYGTGAASDLGTLRGGALPQITVNTILPLISGGAFCPKEARWTVTYTITKPTPLYVSAS